MTFQWDYRGRLTAMGNRFKAEQLNILNFKQFAITRLDLDQDWIRKPLTSSTPLVILKFSFQGVQNLFQPTKPFHKMNRGKKDKINVAHALI